MATQPSRFRAAAGIPSDAIHVADGAKGGDKYLSGKAGGRYGVGGTEREKAQGSKSKSGAPQGQKPPVDKQQ